MQSTKFLDEDLSVPLTLGSEVEEKEEESLNNSTQEKFGKKKVSSKDKRLSDVENEPS